MLSKALSEAAIRRVAIQKVSAYFLSQLRKEKGGRQIFLEIRTAVPGDRCGQSLIGYRLKPPV